MRLNEIVQYAKTDGKRLAMKTFYYGYMPTLLYLGLRTVDFGMFLGRK